MLPHHNHCRLAFRFVLLALLAGALPLSTRAQTVNIAIDASQTVRTVDERIFGLNTAVWDSYCNTPQTISLLQAAGIRCLRFPGGSTSDTYDWSQNKSYDTSTGVLNPSPWATNFSAFANVATNLNAQVFITVNYGSGTPTMAANWVTDANITRHLGIRYWEIGNENYGSWEYDTHAVHNDPYTYAVAARDFIAAMKAVDSTIKIGVVVVTGENTYANTTHTVTNPRTHAVHNGWTPVVLATLANLGVTPDFAIYHRYEQTPGQESDAGLLQDAQTWPTDAADLRQQLTDYLGTAGANVELVVTENNSVYAQPGKQSTSLVNGLYLADSLCAVMQTEFNAFLWWDLRNGQDNTQNNSTALYGWRNYGDYGILSTPPTPAFTGSSTTAYDAYPTYYIFRLLSRFARGGDTVVRATSSRTLLAAYAVKRADGTLAVLVINKHPAANQTANFTLAGITPPTPAAVYSYGMLQDEGARTGGVSADFASSSVANGGTSFSATFAPYSVSVISFVNGVPAITSQPSNQTVTAGSAATFTVTATGAAPLTYQWYKDGTPIIGATSSSVSLAGVQSDAAANYTVRVSNNITTTTSNVATLTVNTPPTTTIPPSSGGGGGGGGGALSAGFYAALALLAAARLRRRARA